MLLSPTSVRAASPFLLRTRFHLTLLSALTAVPGSTYSSHISSPAPTCSAAFSARSSRTLHFTRQIPAAVNEPSAATGEEVAMAAYVETDEIRETRELVSELCRQFYTLGWVSGTGKRTSLEAQSAISQNSPDSIAHISLDGCGERVSMLCGNRDIIPMSAFFQPLCILTYI